MRLPSHLNYDAVADMLEPISAEHISEIYRILEHPMGAEYDDLGFTELFFHIEFLLGLYSAGWPVRLPDLSRIECAVTSFIPRWADYHRLAGHVPPPDHEASIRHAFERLISASRDRA